jgi:hypothetical protein
MIAAATVLRAELPEGERIRDLPAKHGQRQAHRFWLAREVIEYGVDHVEEFELRAFDAILNLLVLFCRVRFFRYGQLFH